MAHAGFPNGLGTTIEQIQEQIANDSDASKRRLMILHKGLSIGEMSYYNLGNHIAEIGIKICNTDYQEKGIGREVLNTRAQHVYELLGFQKVRVNENSWTNQVGELQSSVDYELVSNNFVDWTGK